MDNEDFWGKWDEERGCYDLDVQKEKGKKKGGEEKEEKKDEEEEDFGWWWNRDPEDKDSFRDNHIKTADGKWWTRDLQGYWWSFDIETRWYTRDGEETRWMDNEDFWQDWDEERGCYDLGVQKEKGQKKENGKTNGTDFWGSECYSSSSRKSQELRAPIAKKPDFESIQVQMCASKGCAFKCTGIVEDYCCKKCEKAAGTHGWKCEQVDVSEQEYAKAKYEETSRTHTHTHANATTRGVLSSEFGEMGPNREECAARNCASASAEQLQPVENEQNTTNGVSADTPAFSRKAKPNFFISPRASPDITSEDSFPRSGVSATTPGTIRSDTVSLTCKRCVFLPNLNEKICLSCDEEYFTRRPSTSFARMEAMMEDNKSMTAITKLLVQEERIHMEQMLANDARRADQHRAVLRALSGAAKDACLKELKQLKQLKDVCSSARNDDISFPHALEVENATTDLCMQEEKAENAQDGLEVPSPPPPTPSTLARDDPSPVDHKRERTSQSASLQQQDINDDINDFNDINDDNTLSDMLSDTPTVHFSFSAPPSLSSFPQNGCYVLTHGESDRGAPTNLDDTSLFLSTHPTMNPNPTDDEALDEGKSPIIDDSQRGDGGDPSNSLCVQRRCLKRPVGGACSTDGLPRRVLKTEETGDVGEREGEGEGEGEV